MRVHSHPALLGALRKLWQKQDFIERYSPATKDSGLFFFSSVGLMRPEIVHHRKMLAERYTKPEQAEILLLMPQTETKPFHKSKEYKQVARTFRKRENGKNRMHTCFYAAPFGVIPIELDEVYPLSQHETVLPLDGETIEYVANQITDYIDQTDYKTVILVNDSDNWKKTIANACSRACRRRKVSFKALDIEEALAAEILPLG
jgi:7-cyano-7-deazaguanine tRNA-ribosyltransferase